MSIKTYRFDPAEHLEDDEAIKLFLEDMISEGTSSDFIQGLGVVARARGMSQLAKEIGVSRTSLYRSLSENGNPEFETITKIVKALGCRFSVVADTPSVSATTDPVETIADDRATVC